MQIPEIFKKAIADTFYDKDIEIWSNTTTVDEEGAVIENGKLQKLDSFKGNFQFSTREYIKQEYGKEIEGSAIVTCENTIAKEGDILVYADIKPSNLLLSRYSNEELEQYTQEYLEKQLVERSYVVKSVIPSDSHFTLLVERRGEDV